jgi:6-pyruvoyltetrahydropterin/6-carboxytetrahydropterin synthase
MLQLTKIFHFEMAHPIYGYSGACKNIHGHSYELHVTVSAGEEKQGYIPSPGFVIDFKEIKKTVIPEVVEIFDHKLVLSGDFLTKFPAALLQENLLVMEAEPTAENILIYIQRKLSAKLPSAVRLIELTLYETKNSYAKWINTNAINL